MPIERRLTNAEAALAKHDQMLRGGNGSGVGLIAVVNENTKTMAAMEKRLDVIVAGQTALQKSVNDLVQERRDADMQRKGQVKLYNTLRNVLIFLSLVIGIGAPLGLWRISAQWSEVQQQIQRIPAIPE